MLDLDRATADSHDAIPIEQVESEESKTGEFTAVSPPADVVASTPSLDDLSELADRSGPDPGPLGGLSRGRHGEER